jgi:hypothetical protein
MPTEKELKYLAKIQGKSAPAVAIEHVLETPPPVADNRLADLVEIICALQIGVAASIDEDGAVFLGKGTMDGTNHYIIIYSNEAGGGYAYAFANQDKGTGNVVEVTKLSGAVKIFLEETTK